MPTQSVAPVLTRVASVRFSEDEYVRLQAAADDRGVSVSQIIRAAAVERDLPAPLPPAMDLAMVTELRRAGVLLNQSVRIIAAWKRSAPEDKKDAWERWRLATIDLRTQLDKWVTNLVQQK